VSRRRGGAGGEQRGGGGEEGGARARGRGRAHVEQVQERAHVDEPLL